MEIQGSLREGTRVRLLVPLKTGESVGNHDGRTAAEDNSDSDGMQQSSLQADRVRVLLVDDHALVRAGLSTVLGGHAEIEVVGEASDGLQAIEAAESLKPDVILMDVSMPRLNGIEATRRIKADLGDISVVGLSMHDQRDMAAAMLAAGASAYLSKTEPGEKLIAAILRAGAERKKNEADLAHR
jgi:DNA-binding NarL/FixJ family response regulator